VPTLETDPLPPSLLLRRLDYLPVSLERRPEAVVGDTDTVFILEEPLERDGREAVVSSRREMAICPTGAPPGAAGRAALRSSAMGVQPPLSGGRSRPLREHASVLGRGPRVPLRAAWSHHPPTVAPAHDFGPTGV
jgi:hypothetical protein